ncbi:AraC family transcriptional regulator [Xanthomonas sp. XNM01]|uniref:AraC family transcriptional regulator n=1 Tax=Xanthomonas sp. XNM01 TaxID=2769289 RepID=UPI00177B5A07|nr:AraC family transcriptional regulator [Xanthomonas sp. XNM01]MBD9368349.1 AraC family transcriptional regulator [Xanthomonas sp. XNM01]
MNAARRALWYIESHFAEDIALPDVAAAVGVSPFHLSRLFQAATGTPLVRYLRGRRLTEAARRLADGTDSILALALAAGYASHGSFTRAFGEQFGRTPGEVRQHGLKGLALVEAIALDAVTTPCTHPPRIADAGPLLVAGVGARHRGASVAAIPSQWQLLLAQTPRPQGIAYGVCCNDDEDGSFDYIAGIEVASFARLPSHWQAIRVPARRYVVGHHAGHVSGIRATWLWLLDDYLPAAGLVLADAPEFERYDARFDDTTGLGGVDIWLPLA